jgi:hypothetical protein
LQGQVDLINMTAYLDPSIFLDTTLSRPLENKSAKTVALKLLPIFLQQGASLILQSDNGREFVAEVITEIMAV